MPWLPWRLESLSLRQIHFDKVLKINTNFRRTCLGAGFTHRITHDPNAALRGRSRLNEKVGRVSHAVLNVGGQHDA